MFNPWNEIDNGYEELCIKIAIFFPIYPLFTYVRTSMSQQQQEQSISWHWERSNEKAPHVSYSTKYK